MQIAFQLTELFQIEIDAVIYTDQFTCYNKKRPSKGWSGVHLLHDNASSHKCEVVKSFWASKKVKFLNHPPYSPDLSPCDFFLFPRLKKMLSGSVIYQCLQQIPKEDYLSAFRDWVKKVAKMCFSKGGILWRFVIEICLIKRSTEVIRTQWQNFLQDPRIKTICALPVQIPSITLVNKLTLKLLSKTVADDILMCLFPFFPEKIRLGSSCESSARQTIHMKYQALFSLKKKMYRKKIKMSAAVVISTLRVWISFELRAHTIAF